MKTDDPARAFAPLVVLDRGEPFMPMGARWFLNRSALWFAEDHGCGDRKIAVGRRLSAQRNETVDWLFLDGIGRGTTYSRVAYDANCDYDFDVEAYANQPTRPHDPRDRPAALSLGEGFYLDLMDWARPGPPAAAGSAGGPPTVTAPAYVQRRPAEIDGEPGLRLTYWLLFGAHAPSDDDGRPIARLAHEGDWERVDVVLAGEEGQYEPVELALSRVDGRSRAVAWSRIETADGAGDASHPVLHSARASHALHPRPGRHAAAVRVGDRQPITVVDLAPARCADCPRWRTWTSLRPAGREPWYGFGGAWGDVGQRQATTGPRGPYGPWDAIELPADAVGVRE